MHQHTTDAHYAVHRSMYPHQHPWVAGTETNRWADILLRLHSAHPQSSPSRSSYYRQRCRIPEAGTSSHDYSPSHSDYDAILPLRLLRHRQSGSKRDRCRRWVRAWMRVCSLRGWLRRVSLAKRRSRGRGRRRLIASCDCHGGGACFRIAPLLRGGRSG